MDTFDGNAAVESVAHRVREGIAMHPITPSSPMGQPVDEWSAAGQTNVCGGVHVVVEMPREGGAAGAVHGAPELMATAGREIRNRVALYETLIHLAVPHPTP